MNHQPSPLSRITRELVQPFADLFRTSRALFCVNLTYLFEGLVHFGILTLIAIFLNNAAGLNDVAAGRTVTVLTAGITIAMMLLGPVVDWIGVRKSILIALVFFLLGRIALTLAPALGVGGEWQSAHWISLLGIMLIIVGNGTYQPACYAGVKLFTNKNTSAMGYAMLYGLMNLGGFMSGLISPPLRHAAGISGVFWLYAVITLLEIAAVFFILSRSSINTAVREAKAGEPVDSGEKDELAGLSPGQKLTFYLKRFPFTDLRFMYFIFILIPVQTLFAHNWLTMPQYTNRAFTGMVSQNFEFFSNLNPLLIFVLTPVITALTAHRNTYSMMIWGTIVMSVPTFLLTLGPRPDMLVLFLVLMSVGEAMWSPRFLQWIAEIAPKNMTGIYMGIGQFPWFLTKMITGMYSGWFLMRYCPDKTPPSQLHTETMWFYYGLIAIISPLGLIIARKWMKKGFV